MKNTEFTFRKKVRDLVSLSVIKKNCYSFFLISMMLTLLYPKNISAQNCSLSLTAKNNIESVNDEGRVYFITLQNNSNEEIAVNLSVLNHNSEKNPDQSGTNENVKLNAKLFKPEGQEINGVMKLLPKEPLEFQVKVTVPQGTPINHWNHLQLIATSDKCTGCESSLILYTFIPNPEEK
jgi:hypothetical protein